MSEVRTRIAPSPTGPLHVGTARTALFNFLFARHHKGSFIFRSEDTDKERSQKKFEDEILHGLEWLGLLHDEFFRQSERSLVYAGYIEKLLQSNRAYVSKEPHKQDPSKEVEVVRLKNPNKKITFTDMIRGDISIDTSDLGDFVIARTITDPLYHLVVVVDDYEMDVSHVIRGEDHVSNTPRQILIQEALDIQRPLYAHLPLLLGRDRAKLSKRHGTVSFTEFQKKYLPEAIINYLALLGWNPGTDQEIFSMDELMKQFDLRRVQKGGAIFDEEKLASINREYLLKRNRMDILRMLAPLLSEKIKATPRYSEEFLVDIIPVLLERVQTVEEMARELDENGEFDFFFFDPKEVTSDVLSWKQTSSVTTKEHLNRVRTLVEHIEQTSFTGENVKNALWGYAAEKGKGEVLWPMRMALSGKEKSPDPFVISAILGKEETLLRLQKASDTING